MPLAVCTDDLYTPTILIHFTLNSTLYGIIKARPATVRGKLVL
jgi:hypothetical protein